MSRLRSLWLFARFPKLDYQVWLLALGRLLSQLGSGFTLFYAPIFFVNQVGLSATAVGIGVGSQALTGVVGRFLGGTWADGRWGRKRTLLLATLVSAIAAFTLASIHNFAGLVVGSLLMGLGMGLYWPAAEALIADLTTALERNEAYALNRLADSLGLGLGVVFGGLLIGATGAYRALFVIDGVSFLVFFGIVVSKIMDSHKPTVTHTLWQGWRVALSDRALLVFCLVNTLLTTYIVQISSTLPLYLNNFVLVNQGFAPKTLSLLISALFTWHLVAAVFAQMPVAKGLNRISRIQALQISTALWAIGFISIWCTGMAPTGQIGLAAIALGILALATVTYMPAAAAIVVDMAPESLRGVYLAVNSQCWAAGYFLGPTLGGWALDQVPAVAHAFWLGLAASTTLAIAILYRLNHILQPPPPHP